MTGKDYSFELKNNLAELDKLCGCLEMFGQANELSKKFIQEINLVLDELFSNIICYGFGDNSEHIIRMTITPGKGEFCICIEDDGIPFNPINFEISEMSRSVEECKIGGVGYSYRKKASGRYKLSTM